MKIENNLNISIIFYGYSIILGASYLFAFWRPIGFNIFPYLSAKDFLTTPFDRVIMILLPPALTCAFYFISANSGLKNFLFYLMVSVLCIFSVKDFYRGFELFYDNDFCYENEKSLLLMISVIFFTATNMAVLTYRDTRSHNNKIILFSLMQLAAVMSAGYADGKAVFLGADHVYFLEQKTLCDEHDHRDWVFLSQYSELNFFMNTIDKRICILKDKDLTLIPRYYGLSLGKDI